MTESQAERLSVERAHRRYYTAFVCAGSVLLVGVISWIWHAVLNLGLHSTTLCVDRDPTGWSLLLPDIAAAVVVFVTRRHAHRWYVLAAVCIVTFAAALLAFFVVMIVTTPRICFRDAFA